MSTIKTFEDACQYSKLDPAKVLPDVSGMPAHHQESIIAHAKIVIVTEALNTEANKGKRWIPDWTKSSEWKYYPWFNMSSGSGLSFCDYGCDRSISAVASRLCFKTEKLAEYAGTQFLKLYEQYFLLSR